MSTKVAVVIPVYRELNELEKISLDRCRKILRRYPLIFVAPEGKIFSYFEPGDIVVHFPTKYFQSTQTYNRLMLSPFFYEAFLHFDYILIYQLDAFVFYDALEEFCSLGYDYIGAPWPLVFRAKYRKLISPVGNGGFSLRNVKAHYNLLLTHSVLIAIWHKKKFAEDMFFSHCGKHEDCGFKVAPVSVAYRFSAEFNPARIVKKIGGLPFGCHSWFTRNPEFYVELFRQFGYILNPIKELPPDSDGGLKNWLIGMAIERFNRRLQNGQPLLRYLPTKRFESVRVMHSPVALKILLRLLTEENSLTDKIFFYDAVEQINFRDVTGDLPNLLISAENDSSLITAAERHGLRYGKHIISFQREYIKRCEELLHRFGR